MKKIVYIDGTDWQHEVGETDAVVWPSLEMMKKRVPCIEQCGVVRCELKEIEWVYGGSRDKEAKKTDYEAHIRWYEERIKHLRDIIKRQETYRELKIGNYLIHSDFEKIRVFNDCTIVASYKGGKAWYYLEKKEIISEVEGETQESFVLECKKRFGFDLSEFLAKETIS